VFRLQAFIQFPEFKKNQDWLVWTLTAELDQKEADWGPEGRLEWVPVDQVPGLSLWEGDKLFLPRVLRRESFFGSFWYKDGYLSRWEMTPPSNTPSPVA
jgi:8-oxo-dGTP diphosphatase